MSRQTPVQEQRVILSSSVLHKLLEEVKTLRLELDENAAQYDYEKQKNEAYDEIMPAIKRKIQEKEQIIERLKKQIQSADKPSDRTSDKHIIKFLEGGKSKLEREVWAADKNAGVKSNVHKLLADMMGMDLYK